MFVAPIYIEVISILLCKGTDTCVLTLKGRKANKNCLLIPATFCLPYPPSRVRKQVSDPLKQKRKWLLYSNRGATNVCFLNKVFDSSNLGGGGQERSLSPPKSKNGYHFSIAYIWYFSGLGHVLGNATTSFPTNTTLLSVSSLTACKAHGL